MARRRGSAMLASFPLLAFGLALYIGLSFVTARAQQPWYQAEAVSIQMISGDVWRVTTGDVFIVFTIGLLFVEILRSTRSGGESFVNHAFSVVVFVVALMLFLTRAGYGNSCFFIFMTMTIVDFMAGFIIMALTSRRDISIGRVASEEP